MQARVFLILIISLFLIPCSDAKDGPLQDECNLALKNGNYHEALDLFEEMVASPYHPSMLYNMGICYFYVQDIPNAVLHFEKALKVAPHDVDIKYNLDIARSSVKSEYLPVDDFFLMRFVQSVYTFFSLQGWMVLVVVLMISSIICMTIPLLKMDFLGRHWVRRLGYTFFVVCVLSIILAFALKNDIENSGQVILFQDQPMHSGADDRTDIKYNLKSGCKMKILDSLGQWYLMEIDNKDSGWINNPKFEII